MARLAKFLIPLVLIIGVIGVCSQLYGQLQWVKQQLVRSQQDVAQLTNENDKLLQQLNSIQGERKSLDERVSALRTQLASATTDLERSRTSLEDLKTHYEQLTQERTQLQTQLASAASERDEAHKELERVKHDNANLEGAMSRLRERLTLLDRDYRQVAEKLAKIETSPNSNLSVVSATGPTPVSPSSSTGSSVNQDTSSSIAGAVELPPIIVGKDQATMSLPIRGRLLEVNEAHHFVIVDKGAQDGVRVGMAFEVLRGGSTVGRATVIRVRPQLSACDVIRANTPEPLQAGDLAVQSGL